ncbi:hypothetical protein [Halosegnis sp.]|uniref:hypothetical protein n=1 Tax=Halosegnis sp. TaxID=2864959 RepID=UPI0035D4B283
MSRARSHPAPTGWREVERPPAIVVKYDPREPTLFEHDEDPVAVHVLPETTAADSDNRWRVGLVRGGKTNFVASEPIRTGLSDRAAALSLAEQFMTGYHEVRAGERLLSALLADCCEPAVRPR